MKVRSKVEGGMRMEWKKERRERVIEMKKEEDVESSPPKVGHFQCRREEGIRKSVEEMKNEEE